MKESVDVSPSFPLQLQNAARDPSPLLYEAVHEGSSFKGKFYPAREPLSSEITNEAEEFCLPKGASVGNEGEHAQRFW